jgi:hypothetical protein
LTGYTYKQLTGASSPAATVGDFKLRVFAIRRQIGRLFPVDDMQGIST